MELSVRFYNTLGLLLIIIGLGSQIWFSFFQTEHLSINDGLFMISLILPMTGSVWIGSANINRLFAMYHRINYATALIGIVGLSMLIVFRGYLENLLPFPNVLIVYFLIVDMSWVFLLGLLLGLFKRTMNRVKVTN